MIPKKGNVSVPPPYHKLLNDRPPEEFSTTHPNYLGRTRRVMYEINAAEPAKEPTAPPRLPIVQPQTLLPVYHETLTVRRPRYVYILKLAKPVCRYAPPPFQECIYHTPDSHHDTREVEWVRLTPLPYTTHDKLPDPIRTTHPKYEGRIRRVFDEMNATEPVKESTGHLQVTFCTSQTLLPVYHETLTDRRPRYVYKSKLVKPVST